MSELIKPLTLGPKMLKWFKPFEDPDEVQRGLTRLKKSLVKRYTAALTSSWANKDHLMPLLPSDVTPYNRFTDEKAYPQYVLLSERGAGKTIALLRWALEGADAMDEEALKDLNSDTRIPLYLDISYRGYKSLPGLVAARLKEAGWRYESEHEVVRGGRLCLLIDGFDDLAPNEREQFLTTLQEYLAFNPATAVTIATSDRATADNLVGSLKRDFMIVAVPLPSDHTIQEFLESTGRSSMVSSIKSLIDRDVLRLPLTIRLLVQLLDSGCTVDAVILLLKSAPDAEVVDTLVKAVIDSQDRDSRVLLSWLASGTRKSGSSVAFQLQTVDPRWLQSNDARFVYTLTGASVAAPLAVLATVLWMIQYGAYFAWIPAASIAILLTLSVFLLTRVLYRKERRFPERALKRRVQWGAALLGVRIHKWGYAKWVGIAALAGAALGVALWGLTFIPPLPLLLRILIGLVVVGLSLLLVSGLVGQLLAGLTITWAGGFGSSNWKLDVLAMTVVGLLGAAIFRFADFGEVVEADDEALTDPMRAFVNNVRAQIIFEAKKWGIYGTSFAAVMIAYTHDWTWLWAGLAGAVGIGTFFFGVLGAAYPVVATYFTLRIAERRMGLNYSIWSKVADFRDEGLLVISAESAALRFLHPKFVDELAALP